MRERLPDERGGKTHKFTILYAKDPPDGSEGTAELDELDGYITANTYEDGRPGEVFLRVAKMGDEISGLLDGFATILSVALQSGADLRKICDKLIATRFKPFGPTGNPNISKCTSIYDYLGRYLERRFLSDEVSEEEKRKRRLRQVVRWLSGALEELQAVEADANGLEDVIARVREQADGAQIVSLPALLPS